MRDLLQGPFVNEMRPDMDWDEYCQAKGLNPSWLVSAFKSLRHFKWSEGFDHDKPDRARAIGSATHALIFEPDKFDARFAIWDGDYRTKASREFRDQAAECGRETIKQSEFEEAQMIAFSVISHRLAREIIQSIKPEVSLFCGLDGIQCKGRLDGIGGGVLCDLKTCTNVEKRAFGRVFAQLHYAARLACYRCFAQSLGEPVNEIIVIAAENSPPYDVAVVPIPKIVLDNAWGRVERTIGKIRQAIESDYWPGVADGYYELDVPNWSMDEEEVLDWS